MVFQVVLRHVTIDHHRLGGTLLTNQEHSEVLLGNEVDEIVGTDVVHHGYEDLCILWGVVGGVVVLCDLRVPVSPITYKKSI